MAASNSTNEAETGTGVVSLIQKHKDLVVIQRQGLLLLIPTSQLSSQSHDSVPLTNNINVKPNTLSNTHLKNKQYGATDEYKGDSEFKVILRS